ncbi:hypothetical protein PQR71_22085 [Paraburkholderia fungorum]|uniref:hypothetical protein n=1 Tax=Paraburkholderia fungorum TaxID=134537 RepID=UPI0038BA7BC6
MSGIGFIKAFSILLSGEADRDAKMFRTKQLCANMALVGAVATPLVMIFLALPYQGATPPLAPLIKEKGTLAYLHEQYGMKKKIFGGFKTDEGRLYRLQDMDQLIPLQKLMENETTPTVNVEGFVLGNGKGRFWVTQASTLDGKILLDKDTVEKELAVSRNPFGWNLFYMYAFNGLFWIFSLIDAFKIIRKSQKLNK